LEIVERHLMASIQRLLESNPAVKQQIADAQQTTHHAYRALRMVLRELNALEA
jgi:hypothetical protein